MNPKRVPTLLVVTLLQLFAAGAQAADAVLMSSTAPGYAPGMVIGAHDRLTLPDGASATLLFQSGQMLRLRGPFDRALDQVPSAPADAEPSVLAELLRMQGVDASVIGGTRTLGGAWRRVVDEEVTIDPQRSGTFCIGQATSIWLVRPADDGAAWGVRRHGNVRALVWPDGAARMEWPGDVAIEEGDRFEVVAGGAAMATLTFHVLDGRFASDAAWVAAGLLHGCRDQFDVALHELGRTAGPPELWLAGDHGVHPRYHAGEAVSVTLQANTDGYLYCVAVDADGKAAPIFPAGAIDGARLRDGEALTLPGHRRAAALRAGPKGEELIRCWLADRDISPELPSALLGPTETRLPDQLAANLDDLFARISGSRMVRATLTLTVE